MRVFDLDGTQPPSAAVCILEGNLDASDSVCAPTAGGDPPHNSNSVNTEEKQCRDSKALLSASLCSQTHATYTLRDPEEVRCFLERIVTFHCTSPEPASCLGQCDGALWNRGPSTGASTSAGISGHVSRPVYDEGE